ncbi:hypothetical protein Trydic_g16529 [Trypoxylus dichotomus]
MYEEFMSNYGNGHKIQHSVTTEIQQDLSPTSEDYALANRVTQNLRMERRIATVFPQKFKGSLIPSTPEFKSQKSSTLV